VDGFGKKRPARGAKAAVDSNHGDADPPAWYQAHMALRIGSRVFHEEGTGSLLRGWPSGGIRENEHVVP